jgi:hypothetical protein
MTDTELYVCTGCDLNCKLRQNSEMEKQFPTICPHEVLPYYETTPWKLKVKP